MRRRALFAWVFAFAGSAAAATPLDSLGTLFTTPQERERLEHLRRGEPATSAGPDSAGQSRPAITGFVRRSDGRNTVWIDGVPVPVRKPGAGALLQPGIVNARPDDDTLRVERKPQP